MIQRHTFDLQSKLILLGMFIFLIGLAHSHRPTITESPEARVARRFNAQVMQQPLLDLSLELPDGTLTKLSKLRGKVVLLNFWATWCPPCIQELPDLVKLADTLKDRPFILAALSADDDWTAIEKTINGQAGRMKIYRDPQQSRKQHIIYGTEKLPETYVIDRQGNLRLRFINVQPWNDPEITGYLEWLSEQ